MAPKQVFFRCRQEKGWTTESLVLEGPGVLRNMGRCHVMTEGTQLYPMLTGETEFIELAPELYTPALPSVTSPSESLQLRELTSTKGLADWAAHIQSHQLETDLDTLFLLWLALQPATACSERYVSGLVSAGMVLVLYGTHFLVRRYVDRAWVLCNQRGTSGSVGGAPPVQTVLTASSTEASEQGQAAVLAQQSCVKYPVLPA
jgi:hypothetical protein